MARASCSRESSSARPRRVRRRPPRPTGFPGPTARSCSKPYGAPSRRHHRPMRLRTRRREPWSRRTPTLINARSGPYPRKSRSWSAASKTLRNTDAASKLCADASRNADDDVTRAAALDALTALAKRAQSCRGIASQAAGDSLRRPLDRRRFAAALACLKSCGASNVTAALKTANDADACLRGRCAALEAALPSLQAPPSTMWVDLVEPGLTGDAGSRRAAVDLAAAASPAPSASRAPARCSVWCSH